MVLSEFTTTVPCAGGVTIVGIPKVPPVLPGPSLASTGIVTGVFTSVVAMSVFTTGGFVASMGFDTFITSGTVEHGNGLPGIQTGTWYVYTPGILVVKV